MLDRLLIVDSNALFHRSRSALSRSMGEMRTSFGQPVTGTFGYLNALFSIMEKYQFDSVVPAYDAGNNWRKKENTEYKANREGGSQDQYSDMDLLIQEILPALGFNPVGVPGYEADDVIATISRKAIAYKEVYILTCDKDLLQLVNSKVKVILFNSAKKIQVMDTDGVTECFGVPPEEVKYFKALAGDSSDNVAGIKGIGPKTAVKIIAEAKAMGIDEEFSLADRISLHSKVRDNASTFLGNLRLVTLEHDVENLVWFSSSAPAEQTVESLFTAMEFKSYLNPARFKKIKKSLQIQ